MVDLMVTYLEVTSPPQGSLVVAPPDATPAREANRA